MTGFTIWLTGLSGAGKSTIAGELAASLSGDGRPVDLLDGDEVRRRFGHDLGFSKADRERNTARIAELAAASAREGRIAIVATISPYRAARAQARACQTAPFVEVFVDCPLGELVRRDPKGLYRRALRGEIAQFTGVSDVYEPPLAPEVHIRTDRETPAVSGRRILTWLAAQGLVSSPGADESR